MVSTPDLVFDAAYFTGGRPYGYSTYSRNILPFEHYAAFIDQELRARGIDPQKSTVHLVGCAYGYTAEWLQNRHNVAVSGQDISSHALGRSPVPGRVVQGDARGGINTTYAKGNRYDVIITECLLSCLSDADAQTVVDNCRGRSRTLVHRVWTADGSDVNPDYYNAKTLAEWQALVDPDGVDIWYHDRDFAPADAAWAAPDAEVSAEITPVKRDKKRDQQDRTETDTESE